MTALYIDLLMIEEIRLIEMISSDTEIRHPSLTDIGELWGLLLPSSEPEFFCKSNERITTNMKFKKAYSYVTKEYQGCYPKIGRICFRDTFNPMGMGSYSIPLNRLLL